MADIMVQLQKLANENTAKTFAYNTKEAATSRSWQERMSNTAHQREVKDLIKAGLNPVLSSGGSGAPSYGASSASGSADSAVNAMGQVSSSRTSASAMRYSAKQSAAAARYAADRNLAAASIAAAAQKYAADRRSLDNFFSNLSANRRSKYSADTQYKSTQYSSNVSSETNKWIAVNKQASSYAGLVDKIFGDKNSENSWYKTDIPLFKNGIFGKASRQQINNFSFKTVASAVNNNVRNLMANTLIRNGFKADDHNIGLLAKTLYYQKPINKNIFHRLDITPNSGRVSRHFFGS